MWFLYYWYVHVSVLCFCTYTDYVAIYNTKNSAMYMKDYFLYNNVTDSLRITCSSYWWLCRQWPWLVVHILLRLLVISVPNYHESHIQQAVNTNPQILYWSNTSPQICILYEYIRLHVSKISVYTGGTNNNITVCTSKQSEWNCVQSVTTLSMKVLSVYECTVTTPAVMRHNHAHEWLLWPYAFASE